MFTNCKLWQLKAYSFWQYWQTSSDREVVYFHADDGCSFGSFGSNNNYNSESKRSRIEEIADVTTSVRSLCMMQSERADIDLEGRKSELFQIMGFLSSRSTLN